MKCEACGHVHKRGALAAVLVQFVMWVGWGAIGGGTWVIVGELIKKYVVRAS